MIEDKYRASITNVMGSPPGCSEVGCRYMKEGRMLYRKKELHDGWVFKRGDLYLANLNPFRGSEQGGTNVKTSVADWISSLDL